MSYVQRGVAALANTSMPFAQDESGQVIAFPPASLDLAFDDGLIDNVKAVWSKIVGSDLDDVDFMQFQGREGMEDDEDY